jgi:hypothetical protein
LLVRNLLANIRKKSQSIGILPWDLMIIGKMMQFLIIAVASGSWTTDNRIAVVGKAAGKQVNATLASDGNGDVDVALQPRKNRERKGASPQGLDNVMLRGRFSLFVSLLFLFLRIVL